MGVYAMTLIGIFNQNFHDLTFYNSFVFPVLLGTPGLSITFILYHKQDLAVCAFVGIGLFAIPSEGVAHVTPIPYLFSTK
jgi:hypothetical protein